MPNEFKPQEYFIDIPFMNLFNGVQKIFTIFFLGLT